VPFSAGQPLTAHWHSPPFPFDILLSSSFPRVTSLPKIEASVFFPWSPSWELLLLGASFHLSRVLYRRIPSPFSCRKTWFLSPVPSSFFSLVFARVFFFARVPNIIWFVFLSPPLPLSEPEGAPAEPEHFRRPGLRFLSHAIMPFRAFFW